MKTLVLRIDEAASGAWPVTLTDAGGLEVQDRSPVPAAAGDPAAMDPAAIRGRFAQRPVPDLDAVARQLGAWALPPKVRDAIEALRHAGQDFRLVLDVRANELRDLPWELMRSSHLPDFLDVLTPCVRLHAAGRPPPVEWPMRVLVVVGAAAPNDNDAPADRDDILAEEEVFAIERTLHAMGHSIDREVLRRPTPDALFRTLRELRPHVFVFIGHCDQDAISGGPVLRFQNEPDSWNWGPARLALDMRGAGWVPSLVLLNACRTQDRGASFGFAEAFIQAGVPACITMQGDVRGDVAGRFSAQVLQSLCDDEPLDLAVARARLAIAGPAPLEAVDWALPVLSMARPGQPLFPERPKHALPDHGRAFDDVHFFADRRDLRRTLRGRFQGAATDGPVHLAVVAGEPRCGKSHLAKWCLQNFALLFDTAVRYVPIAGSSTVDFVALLRRMRDGFGGATGGDPAFHAFNRTLNQVLSGQVPTAWDGQPVVDEGRGFDPAVVTWEHAIRDIFAAFLEALQQLSAERRVVIILDQFRAPDRTPAVEPRLFQDVLVPHLLRPLQQGLAPGVLLILVMESADCLAFGIDALVPPANWITVHPHIPDPLDAVTRELFWYPEEEWLQKITAVVDVVNSTVGGGQPLSVGVIERIRVSVTHAVFAGDSEMRSRLGIRQMA